MIRVMFTLGLLTFLLATCADGKFFGQRSSDSDEISEGSEEGKLSIDLSENPLAEGYASTLTVNVLPEDNESINNLSQGALQINAASTSLHGQKSLRLIEDPTCKSDSPNEPWNFNSNSDSCACSHIEKLKRQNIKNTDALKNYIKAKIQVDRNSDRDRYNEIRDIALAKGEACFGLLFDQAINLVVATNDGKPVKNTICYEFDWGLESPYPTDAFGKEVADSDACLVEFTRLEFDSAKAFVDLSTTAQASVLCAAKKNEMAKVLDVGEAIELDDLVKKISEKKDKGADILSARIEREEDIDGRPTYRTEISIKPKCTDCLEDSNISLKINHTSMNESNSEYTGSVSVKMDLNFKKKDGEADLQTEVDSDKFKAVGIQYSNLKDEEGSQLNRLQMRLIIARMNKKHFSGSNDPFADNGEIDLNAGSGSGGAFNLTENDMPQANDFISEMKLIKIEGFPTENLFNFAYWRNPGGNYDENARGFVFNMTRDENNVNRGCAIAGASSGTDLNSSDSISIRKALKEDLTIKPKGYLKPFSCDASSNPAQPIASGEKVWRQCFYQNSDGRYVVDSDIHGKAGFDFLPVADQKIRNIEDKIPQLNDALKRR